MKKSIPPAELTRCHRTGDYIYFCIGKAQDREATLTAFTEQVPSSDYRYDAFNQEWRVEARHANVLDTLFINFPTILRQQSGAHVPLGSSPYNGSKFRIFTPNAGVGLAKIKADRFSLLAWVSVGLICVAIWPWLSDVGTTSSLAVRIIEPTSLPSTAASIAGISSPTAPTVTVEPTPKPVLVTVSQLANLRTGPGTSYDVQGQVEVGESLALTGEVQVPGDYSWYRIDNGLWIYSLLVSGPGDELPIIQAETVP